MTESLRITTAKLLVELNLPPSDPGLEAFLGFLEFMVTSEENPTLELLVARKEIETALCSSFCQTDTRYLLLHQSITHVLEGKDSNG